jgi:integrase/recombinase XerD
MSAQEETFQGPLAEAMADFVAFKRMQGYDYRSQARSLMAFDRFLRQPDRCCDLLSNELFHAYLATTAGLCPSTREGRLAVVRQFSRHLHVYRPESALVPPAMLPRHCRNVRFYRIEPEQVRDLMDEAARLRPKRSIRPGCIRFLIGLLYATGLRISEALNLSLGDIDAQRATLFVRRGKFGKDRVVAMTSSTAEALDGWLDLRSRHAATGPSAPLLVSGPDTPLTYHQAGYAFRVLCRRCGMQGRPPPRLHDLRHNFACRCIARWREEARDVQALLPVLANAMGHVDFFATQGYIHLEPAVLQQAAVSFHDHFQQHREDRP